MSLKDSHFNGVNGFKRTTALLIWPETDLFSIPLDLWVLDKNVEISSLLKDELKVICIELHSLNAVSVSVKVLN